MIDIYLLAKCMKKFEYYDFHMNTKNGFYICLGQQQKLKGKRRRQQIQGRKKRCESLAMGIQRKEGNIKMFTAKPPTNNVLDRSLNYVNIWDDDTQT